MYNEAYLGIFRIREASFAASMPLEHACGLWQAWELPDGDYIVQPVDESYAPLAESYLLDAMDFAALLQPEAGPPESPADARKKALDAGSPDLLDFWYRQEGSNAPTGSHNAEGDDEEEDAPDADLQEGMEDAFENTPVAVDERIFSPLRHPDELLTEQEQPTQPEYPVKSFPKPGPDGKAQKSFISGLFGKTSVAASSPGGRNSRKTVSVPVAPKPGAAGIKGKTMSEGLDIQTLEKNMREEFGLLIEQVREAPQPALEQKIANLLAKEGPFTTEQKFVFSEFGLALRRKRKHYLALAAHKRALALAEDDENVLFNVARAEYELGNNEHAKNCLEKALALAPGFASAAAFLSFLNSSSDEGEKHP